MSPNPWFKFYGGEYLSDPKIDQLTPLERACWVTLLCLANVSNKNGLVENLKVFTLLTKSGIYPLDAGSELAGAQDDYKDTLGVLEHFEALGMIERVDTFSYQIKNWSKRQDAAQTAAERQAKYRENKKSNEKVTERVTKVTLEKSREEKNKEEIAKPISPPFREVNQDSEGRERPPREKKDPTILALREKMYERLRDEHNGVAPTPSLGDYLRLKAARKAHLSDEDCLQLLEDEIAENDARTISAAFSNSKIDKYRQDNHIV